MQKSFLSTWSDGCVGDIKQGYQILRGSVGDLREAVDGQDHVELALSKATFADVDVDISDSRLGELASFRSLLGAFGQVRDAVPGNDALDWVSLGMLSASGRARRRVAAGFSV